MERDRASSAHFRPPRSFLRILLIIATAAVPALVLATHVYGHFHRVRERVVRAPLEAGATPVLSVPLPDVPGLAGAPVALVAVVRNDRSDELTVTVAVDGAEIAAVRIPASASRRLDASATLPSGAPVVTFAAGRAGWTLETLELANVHGF